MTIENNSVVSVNYTLTEKDSGAQVEQTTKEHPFQFIFGTGGLLEDFENNLRGKKVGDTFDFFVEHSRGYGKRDEQHVVQIPREAFHLEDGTFDHENVKVDVTLPMQDNEGNRLYGKVMEVNDAHVKMDFNHPLAGTDLHFVGEVLEVRPATADELAHGHVHGEHGHHH